METKMKDEMVSIIVPIYRVETELNRCVKSLLKQTYANIEIILVDDGSPDNCPQMCDRYAKEDKRVKVVHKKNGGLSDARNAGLRTATGKYVLYVDSDDYIELDSCERLLSGMNDDVDFVVGIIKEIKGDSIKFQKHSKIQNGCVYDARDFIIDSIKKNEWYAPAVLNLYNRQFLLDNELYYKVGCYFEDHQMLPRLYLAAKKISYIDYPFYNYVIREGSIMTSPNSQKKVQTSLAIWAEWYEIFSKIEDKELQRYMYGILIRYYLRNSRVRKIMGWKVDGINFKFAFKYAFGFKERIKVLYYTVFPKMYFENK